MMFYLTGAAMSIAKNSEAPQTDVSKSLGGYVSTSIVPNGNVNAVFDMISLTTLKNKTKETIAIALVNSFDFSVSDVNIRIITSKRNICKYRLAAVNIGDDFAMEHIPNRYSEPVQAEFHDIDFYRASVIAKIIKPAVVGEIISIQPFDVTIAVEDSGMEGTMNAIINAFSISSDYIANKLSENEFEIISRAENVITEPVECLAICTEDAEIEFSGYYQNEKNNTALIANSLEPGQAIGLWLQRQVVPIKISNEELLKQYNDKVVIDDVEEIELFVDYQTVENNQNNG